MFLCIKYVMGRREQEVEKGRLDVNLARLLRHGSVKCHVKNFETLPITVQSLRTGWVRA